MRFLPVLAALAFATLSSAAFAVSPCKEIGPGISRLGSVDVSSERLANGDIQNLPEEETRRFEKELGFPLPEDIRRFYTRFSPWGVLPDWKGWDPTVSAVRRASGVKTHLAPIDHGSYSADGWDIVAAVRSSHDYDVLVYCRRTREIRKYENLRSYFIGEVWAEINRTAGECTWPDAEGIKAS